MKVVRYVMGFIVMAGVIFLTSCNDSGSKKEGMDLMKYGIPITIFAPADVQVSKVGGGKTVDLKISDGNAYDVMIFMSTAQTRNIQRIKQFKKEEVSFYPNFKKIVEEYNEGFIYEIYSPDGSLSYDFYAIKIIGDQEIDFITSNKRPYTENEVKSMIKTILY